MPSVGPHLCPSDSIQDLRSSPRLFGSLRSSQDVGPGFTAGDTRAWRPGADSVVWASGGTAVQVPGPLACVTPAVSLLQPHGSVHGWGRPGGLLWPPVPTAASWPTGALPGFEGGPEEDSALEWLVLLLVSAAAHPERRLGAGGPQGLGPPTARLWG